MHTTCADTEDETITANIGRISVSVFDRWKNY